MIGIRMALVKKSTSGLLKVIIAKMEDSNSLGIVIYYENYENYIQKLPETSLTGYFLTPEMEF
ncbi:hypothetical protein [Roseivirga pacifica]|uniref:hypothetical protein n=1 Tax=Roseivirga pacifica TaxID=1267423 RepID=UPI00227D1C68|nr:hypothetical protein [Roseivirga pacifica]